jgi:hypothetical protein
MSSIPYTGSMPLKEALEKVTEEVVSLEYRLDITLNLHKRDTETLIKYNEIFEERDKRIKELEETIEAALRIKDLWYPPSSQDEDPEHEGEYQALYSMKEKFETVLKGK